MEKEYTIYATGFPKSALFIRKGTYIPEKYIFVKNIKCKSSEINKIAEDIFNKEIESIIETSLKNSDINVGDVVSHSDGNIVHRGVVLQIKDDKAFLVFCTTNKDWNKRSRITTKEETDLFHFKSKTYIAPVTKDLRELYKIGYTFPNYRVKEFINEFM